MKKTFTGLALALGLSLAAPCDNAQAVEFNAKGWWWMSFNYVGGGDFTSKTRDGARKTGARHQGGHYGMDNFVAAHRIVLQLDAKASEDLSGTVKFEIGDQFWGQQKSGGALGSDGTIVELKNAFIDWTVPDTSLKFRMGIQGMALPGYAFESAILVDDVAGVTAGCRINDELSLGAFWLRPYNDNYEKNEEIGHRDPSGFLDNIDFFGVTLPVSLDGVKVTPWVMGGVIGPNAIPLYAKADAKTGVPTMPTNPLTVNTQAAQTWAALRTGILPAAVSTNGKLRPDSWAGAVWAGVTGAITAADPWRISFDVNYGSVSTDEGCLNRSGWFALGLVEYKTDFCTPGIYGWYSSGDDDNPNNGSERMPTLSQVNVRANSISNFGFRGSPYVDDEGILGGTPVGLWGVGARVKDMAFCEWLKSTLLVNVFGGTNSPKMASYILGKRAKDGSGRQVYRNITDFNDVYGVYLTTADTGIEINLNNSIKVYENLTLQLEAAYIHLWLDKGTWGRSGGSLHSNLNYEDSWKVSLGIEYAF